MKDEQPTLQNGVSSKSHTIKAAHVFSEQDSQTAHEQNIKSTIMLNDNQPIDIDDEQPQEHVFLEPSTNLKPQKSNRKWLFFLSIAILVTSSIELALFVIQLFEQTNWLAGMWLVIFTVIGILLVKLFFNELRGLRQLKRQSEFRYESEIMAGTAVIGLAEQHCLKIAASLPSEHKILVKNWQGSFKSHHSDSEVLALFEHKVLAPIDKFALKQVSKNASAAGVMIAVSPFALLDMLIVLWRNIHMMNQVSGIYGLHLGYWGRVKLIRKIFHTMLYAGAAEILSDAGNYALGAGVTGKLSTRVAQGMGAGVLTARIGLRAINESRPLPWLSEAQPSLSDITKHLLTDLNKQLK